MDYQQRRKSKAAQTEQEILTAAMELSRRRGFDRVTVREISARAGVTTGAFYHHFSSKEELLSRGFAPLDDRMERAMRGHERDDPRTRLRLLLETYADFMETQGAALVGRYYERRLADPRAASIDPTRYTLRAMVGCLRDAGEQGLIREGADVEELAGLLFRHFRGVVIDWVLHRGEYSLTARLEQDYELFSSALSGG